MSDDAIANFFALQEERRRRREELEAPSLVPPEALKDAPLSGTPEFETFIKGLVAIYATAPQLTDAPYTPAAATPWTSAPAPAPAPVAHVTAPASAPVTTEERDRQIANDPRVKGREALAAELAAALPGASADAIAAKVAALGTRVVAPSLRHGRPPFPSSPVAPAPEKRSGLALAMEDLARRDAGLPPVSSGPRSGLAAVIDDMVARDQAHAGVWMGRRYQPPANSGPRSGLAAAVDELIAEDHARASLATGAGHQSASPEGGGLRAAVDALIADEQSRR